MSAGGFYSTDRDDLRIALRLTPRSSRDAIEGSASRIKLVHVAGDGAALAPLRDSLCRGAPLRS